MTNRPLYAAAVLMCLVSLAACFSPVDPEPEPPATPAEFAAADSAFGALTGISQSAFRQAFTQLQSHNYHRYTRTEQFDGDDYLLAFEERVAEHRTDGGTRVFPVVERDSAGAFDYGYFRHFVSENVSRQDPSDLSRYVLPEDPAYLSPRNRDAYVYRFLPDTLMWDVMAQVIEVRAVPVEGDGQNIRRVRMFVDRNTDELIAVHLQRIDLALFFREESSFYIHIRRTRGGDWVPYNTRFETRILMPFRPAQLFRTVSTYYAFTPSTPALNG